MKFNKNLKLHFKESQLSTPCKVFEIELGKLMKNGTIRKQDPARNLSSNLFVNDQFCRKRCTEAQIHSKISIYVCT